MSTGLSDYNAKKSQKVSRKNVYADLDLNFRLHPNTGDVKPLVDIDAVKNAVKNLLLTNYGDRPFHPEVGSNVTALLFEPCDEFTAQNVKSEIKLCLDTHEPRITAVAIETIADANNNRFAVTIGFTVLFSPIVQQIEFYLERLR